LRVGLRSVRKRGSHSEACNLNLILKCDWLAVPGLALQNSAGSINMKIMEERKYATHQKDLVPCLQSFLCRVIISAGLEDSQQIRAQEALRVPQSAS